MPGWFCKNSSTGQLDPFADQGAVHQRAGALFFYHFTANTTNHSSDLISAYSTSLLSPIFLIIQLLGRFHAAVTADVGNCWYYLTLKNVKWKEKQPNPKISKHNPGSPLQTNPEGWFYSYLLLKKKSINLQNQLQTLNHIELKKKADYRLWLISMCDFFKMLQKKSIICSYNIIPPTHPK